MKEKFLESLDEIPDGEDVLTLLSGGIDSTVALYKCKDENLNPRGLEFSYDGRSEWEEKAVKDVVEDAGIEKYTVDIPCIDSDNGKIALNESNMIYYALACDLAEVEDIGYVVGSQIKDDWKDFDVDDATPEYYSELEEVIEDSQRENPPELVLPFIHYDKEQVVEEGLRLGAPLEKTYSCIEGEEEYGCGECFQCEEREELSEKFGIDL